MSMQTGENEQGLRKILDLTRAISIVLLLLHFYFYCFSAFKDWNLTTPITNRLMENFMQTGLFTHFHTSKWMSLAFLVVSLLGASGRKNENLKYRYAYSFISFGLAIYFTAYFTFYLDVTIAEMAVIYMVVTAIGYILILRGGTLLSRVIQMKISNTDIFNKENETFPQEEKLLENEYSVNLPAQYYLKDRSEKAG